MNLSADIGVFRKAFGEAGVLTKVFLVIGLFLSISSLTSLSSKIVAWRGFIKDALDFYTGAIIEPIAAFSAKFGLGYTLLEIHSAVLLSSSLLIGMNMLATIRHEQFDSINLKYQLALKPKNYVIYTIAVFGALIIWISYGVNESSLGIRWSLAWFAAYPLFLSANLWFFSKLNDSYNEPNCSGLCVGYYCYVVALALAVGIFAAINSGLKKDIPDKAKTTSVDAQQEWNSLPLA